MDNLDQSCAAARLIGLSWLHSSLSRMFIWFAGNSMSLAIQKLDDRPLILVCNALSSEQQASLSIMRLELGPRPG